MSKTEITRHIATSRGGGYTASDLQPGEIGINYLDGSEAIYIKNSTNEIIPFANSANVHNTITVVKDEILNKPGEFYPGSTSGEVFNDYSTNVASGRFSHAEGHNNKAIGEMSHAEGVNNRADGIYSHTEGFSSHTVNEACHAEGSGTTAAGKASHAEGLNTTANGNYSHAEGNYTKANADDSHAEGFNTKANARHSHAEGWDTTASGISSHAEGYQTIANGKYSHAGGHSSSANGEASFSHGVSAISQNEGEIALGVKNSSVFSSMLEGELTARATLFSVGMGVDGTARNAMELKYNGDLYLYGAGNYNGRNSLGNAAYDSTVQTVQSLLGGGSSIASGSKVLICNASKTETGKTVTDSSVNVEDGTMVTVMFINGHSGKSTGEYISLSVNGIKGNIVSSKKMDSSSNTYMPPFISPNSVLSLVYYNKLWYLVGNPIIAHSYCYDSSFYYFYNIWGNRLMMYTIHQVSNNTSLGIITFKFPIIFNNGNSLAAVAAGNGGSTYLTGRITNLKKDSLGIQFTDENYINKGNGCIIVAGLI